ncbi:MAG: lysophospholipid acyltransferase family protein [Fusobacteriaceae bacterium]
MYKLQYILMLFFTKIIKIIPEKSRFSFAEFLGTLVYKTVKKRKIIALANLKLAFPEKSDIERERIALKSYKIMFKAFLSTIWFEDYLKDEKKIKIVNKEVIDKVMSENRGAITVAMHMGNMEASGKMADFYHFVTVAKTQRNPYIDNFITENRKKLNITLLKKSKKTGGELVNSLHENSIIALFSDHRDKGANVEFFGEETIAPTGAVSLALRNRVPLFICYNVMNDDNTCTTYFSDEIKLVDTGNFKDDLNVNMQTLMHEMEKIITRYPEQWMWFHDRWGLYKKITGKR